MQDTLRVRPANDGAIDTKELMYFSDLVSVGVNIQDRLAVSGAFRSIGTRTYFLVPFRFGGQLADLDFVMKPCFIIKDTA